MQQSYLLKYLILQNISLLCFICLQAAQFGKSFLSDLKPDSYVKMCRILRVLNSVRHERVGIPLTYTQYPLLID